MTLTNITTVLTNYGIPTASILGYLQTAFDYVVKTIPLNQTVIPLRWTTAFMIAKYGDTSNYGTMVVSGSQVCIKEVKSFLKTDMSEDHDDAIVAGALSVGIIGETDYGYTSFEDVNEEQQSTPSIYYAGDLVANSSFDDTFCLMQGYVYPFFCRTSDGETVDEHRYDIDWMNTTYTSDNLTVDSFLGMLVITMAIGEYNRDLGNMSSYNNCRDWYKRTLNMFLVNKVSLDSDKLSSLGRITGRSLR